MQIVLYTDDMEPITVLDLPFSLACMEAVAARTNNIWLEVLMPLTALLHPMLPETTLRHKNVCIWWEKFSRQGRNHWFFFTRDEELAMLLRPSYLPGQREDIERMNRNFFAEGFALGLRSGLERLAGGM